MVMVMIVIVVIMVVVVMVVMNFFLLTVHENAKMRSDNAAFHGRLDRKANARQTDGIHLADERILVVQKLIQGGGDHVARRAHSTIQIQRPHSLSSYHSMNYDFFITHYSLLITHYSLLIIYG